MEKTIEIDCPPGSIRPGDLIGNVIAGTCLPLRDDSGRFFGNWTWNYSDIPDDVWNNAVPVVSERLTDLYHAGIIRYASW